MGTDTDTEVEVWRQSYAEKLGYSFTDAVMIALNKSIQMHDLEKLITAGCDPETALAITA